MNAATDSLTDASGDAAAGTAPAAAEPVQRAPLNLGNDPPAFIERKTRKPRVPRAQQRKDEQQAAYLRGYDAALRGGTRWPGAVAALFLAGAAFVAGAWLF